MNNYVSCMVHDFFFVLSRGNTMIPWTLAGGRAKYLCTHLSKRNSSSVNDVIIISFESWVWLVFNNKHDVS